MTSTISWTSRSSPAREHWCIPLGCGSWLSAIEGQISMALVPPTPAMMQVADGYIHDADAGVSRLQSDVAAANKVLHH